MNELQPFALALLGVLWLPYAAVVWWRLRTNGPLRSQDIAETRKWVEWHPSMLIHMLEPTLPVLLPVSWELVCVLNGLLWPVSTLIARWKRV
jgi:hypothetical protein